MILKIYCFFFVIFWPLNVRIIMFMNSTLQKALVPRVSSTRSAARMCSASAATQARPTRLRLPPFHSAPLSLKVVWSDCRLYLHVFSLTFYITSLKLAAFINQNLCSYIYYSFFQIRLSFHPLTAFHSAPLSLASSDYYMKRLPIITVLHVFSATFFTTS